MSEEKYSFYKVNYLLRPCKQIERKIMIETLKKLKLKNEIENYKYIGMGSIHYYDFILIHKFLNIKKLVSIDDKETKKRFNFNKPYEFIKFYNQKTNDFLAELSWNKNENYLIWLDYDQKLNSDMLGDIALVAQNCNPQDILIFTIDARCPPEKDPKNDHRLPRKEFWDEFGSYTSKKFNDISYVRPKYFIELLQDICLNFIGEKEVYKKVKFHQIFSFKYKDGAQMFTLGGIFDKNADAIKDIKNLGHVSTDRRIVEIDAPILTYHEKFHLDAMIDTCRNLVEEYEKQLKEEDRIKITKKMEKKMNEDLPFELSSIDELKSYVKYYKYFPQYYEGII